MKKLLPLLFLCQLLVLTGCSTLAKQDGLPSMAQIDDWVNHDKYGLALTSLKHIPPSEKLFADYVNKRKTVMILAAAYEKTVLKETQKAIKKEDWADAIKQLNIARNNYPNSGPIHDRYNMVIKQHQKRIHKLDAKSLLARAQLLYNKLPISQKNASNSPINIAAQWNLQSLQNELADMHTRLMAMTEQLLDDNEVTLAEMCVQQAKILTKDTQSLATIQALQVRIDVHKKEQRDAAKKKIEAKKLRAALTKKKKQSRKVRQLIKKINYSLDNDELISAEKQLVKLSKLAPNSEDFQNLKIKHRQKVDMLVYKLIEQGNSLYRQEKIAEAKKVWQTALTLDTQNKTLQAQIRRASKVLMKLKELRTRRSAVRQ